MELFWSYGGVEVSWACFLPSPGFSIFPTRAGVNRQFDRCQLDQHPFYCTD